MGPKCLSASPVIAGDVFSRILIRRAVCKSAFTSIIFAVNDIKRVDAFFGHILYTLRIANFTFWVARHQSARPSDRLCVSARDKGCAWHVDLGDNPAVSE